MTGLIPIDGIHHIGVLVSDIQASMQAFATIFGVPRWEYRELTNADFAKPYVRGRNAPQHFLSAVGLGGPLSFELVQSVPGDHTVYGEDISVGRRPGLHHFFATIMHDTEFADLRRKLRLAGIDFAQGAEISSTIDYHYLDTRAWLGTYFELLVLKSATPEGRAPDAVTTFGPEITATSRRLPIAGIAGIGIVGGNPKDLMRDYGTFLGIDRWADSKLIAEGRRDSMVNPDLTIHSGVRGVVRIDLAPESDAAIPASEPRMAWLVLEAAPRCTVSEIEQWARLCEVPVVARGVGPDRRSDEIMLGTAPIVGGFDLLVVTGGSAEG